MGEVIAERGQLAQHRVVQGRGAEEQAVALEALGLALADLRVESVHDGQVRLSFIGPLITLSNVPRDWAIGLTTLP